jgi:hypothetical protein
VTALANGREELLDDDTSVAQIWEMGWYPDWCTGIILHAVVRKGSPEKFIEQYHATLAEYPTLSKSMDLKHAVMLLYLAGNRVQEAGEFMRVHVLPGLKEENYFWQYWIGGSLSDSGQQDLFNEFLEHLSATAQREGRRSNMARAQSILLARNALEKGEFHIAAQALEDWSPPELVFHFSEGLVFQSFLSSIGALESPSRSELEGSLDLRLAGPELALAEMFLRHREARPGSVFPHPTWRPEFRLWLALWLKAKGDTAGARAVAEPAIDRRYGLTHSQPALSAFLAKL